MLNPVFYHTQTIKDFNHHIVDDPFWISSITIKETTNVELYAGDTQGFIHVFEYNAKEEKFNIVKNVAIHKFSVFMIISSLFDSMIYSVGFDRHLIGYDTVNDVSFLLSRKPQLKQ